MKFTTDITAQYPGCLAFTTLCRMRDHIDTLMADMASGRREVYDDYSLHRALTKLENEIRRRAKRST